MFTSSTLTGNYEDADIVVYSMASGQRKTVHRGGFYARYVPTGHLVYTHEGTLFAVPFDLNRLEVTGQPAPILDRVATNPATGGMFPKWSRHGRELFYRTTDSKIMVATYPAAGDSFHADKPRLWSPGQFSRPGPYSNFDVHPDGKRFAVLKAPAIGETSPVNKVSFIFNFFDDLRRKVPPGKN